MIKICYWWIGESFNTSELGILQVYKERFSIRWSRFLLQFHCEYLKPAITMLHQRIHAYYIHQSLKKVIRSDKKRLNKSNNHSRSVSKWWGDSTILSKVGVNTNIYIKVRTVMVDLGPQQNGKIAIIRAAGYTGFVIIIHPPCSPHTSSTLASVVDKTKFILAWPLWRLPLTSERR